MGCPIDPYFPGPPDSCGGCDPIVDPLCTGIPPIVVVSGGGGIDPGTLNDAIDSLSNQLTGMIQKLSDLVSKIINGIATLLAAIVALWSNILKPAISAIATAVKRIAGWVDKIFKPYLDLMRRIRYALEEIYNTFLRPMIGIIQRVRQVLRILELFHVGFARRLDQRLAQLEGIILAPFLKMLARVNTLGNWVSFILNAQLLIYRALLLGSMKANRGGVFNLVTSAPALGSFVVPGAAVPAPDETLPFLEDVHAYVTTRGGVDVQQSLIVAEQGKQDALALFATVR